MKVRVGIIGARAYTARELIVRLLRHPAVTVAALQARVDKPEDISSAFPSLRGRGLPPVEPVDLGNLHDAAAVFLCMPHGAAFDFARELHPAGIRVFDLSADFRFRHAADYERVYEVKHGAPELTAHARYGLPELFRSDLMGARLVACAGCYPTSILLALAPLMKRDMVEGSLIADSKSGVSGAGRKLSETTHFCEANESLAPYGAPNHRHRPEIEENLSRLACDQRTLTFVPHLVPMERGIVSTCYATLREPVAEDRLREMYATFYANEPFVRLLPPGAFPSTRAVAHTNFCDIALRVDDHCQRLVVMSAIDNLVKGASGQAIQCMNTSFGLQETLGLL